jgi:hypothetical protein
MSFLKCIPEGSREFSRQAVYLVVYYSFSRSYQIISNHTQHMQIFRQITPEFLQLRIMDRKISSRRTSAILGKTTPKTIQKKTEVDQNVITRRVEMLDTRLDHRSRRMQVHVQESLRALDCPRPLQISGRPRKSLQTRRYRSTK